MRSKVDDKNNEKYVDTELPAFLTMLSGDEAATKTLSPPYRYIGSIDVPRRHRKWWQRSLSTALVHNISCIDEFPLRRGHGYFLFKYVEECVTFWKGIYKLASPHYISKVTYSTVPLL